MPGASQTRVLCAKQQIEGCCTAVATVAFAGFAYWMRQGQSRSGFVWGLSVVYLSDCLPACLPASQPASTRADGRVCLLEQDLHELGRGRRAMTRLRFPAAQQKQKEEKRGKKGAAAILEFLLLPPAK